VVPPSCSRPRPWTTREAKTKHQLGPRWSEMCLSHAPQPLPGMAGRRRKDISPRLARPRGALAPLDWLCLRQVFAWVGACLHYTWCNVAQLPQFQGRTGVQAAGAPRVVSSRLVFFFITYGLLTTCFFAKVR
jgi:hypothetical protein